MKTAVIALISFAIGAMVALVVRTALHQPDAASPGAVPGPASHASVEPTRSDGATPAVPAATAATAATAASAAPANSICAVCGMEVDPSLPTVDYRGQPIGIGCIACLPKLKEDIERYGPAALQGGKAE
ncbi:MAG TPA: hypothetical protein VEL07_11075 [Planctomycetota bacterium]|nr:hypothetical protein [Planctomycetota bacterium]